MIDALWFLAGFLCGISVVLVVSAAVIITELLE